MKKIFILVLAIGALFLLTGCTNSMTNQKVAKLEAKEQKAMLFVYRPHNDFWRKKRYSIYINGAYEQTLLNGFYFVFEKNPGSYKIELKEDVEYKPEVFTISLDARAGRVHYLQFGAENIESHPDFKEVPPSVMQAQEHLIREGF